ncbi:hypothetical protein FOL47_011105 [Perkinsus chesapeaki]|uniref:Uncharacterized protein n=1 Tax=Perkinsus chesapeaki TaxID=330153 RepID=A0A7J6MN69_PERCH|nr:hypothetical protein FOL47_011105 [Perkinsus chesapeaki]
MNSRTSSSQQHKKSFTDAYREILTLDEVITEHLKAVQGDAALLAAETKLLAKVKRCDRGDTSSYIEEARRICQWKVDLYSSLSRDLARLGSVLP